MSTIKITKIKLDMLEFFKDKSSEWYDVLDHFNNEYKESEIEETYDWISKNGWFEKGDDQRGFRLNSKGRDVLKKVQEEKETKEKKELKVSEKELRLKWLDRFIDNWYKVISVPILIWTLVLQCNQSNSNADIKKLQEKLKGDSIQFSTTLYDLQNQLTRQNIQLQNNRETIERLDSVIYSSSLKSSLKVDKSKKKK